MRNAISRAPRESDAHSVIARHDARARKRENIVAAAREAFLLHGYVGTAMSDIASRTGGSKTTLWNYFPSKQHLFAAVVDDIVKHYAIAHTIEMDSGEPVDVAMRRFAMVMMTTILSEPILSLRRLVTAEARRFPELGGLFYERGPKPGEAHLAAFIAAAMADGRLRNGDPLIAAQQFGAMCQSGCFQKALLGIDAEVDVRAIERDVDAALDTFLRAWKID